MFWQILRQRRVISWLRKKCIAINLPSISKSTSMIWIINGEISWKAVCNGNQSVKTVFKSMVNRNA